MSATLQPKSIQQVRAIFALKKKLRLDDELLHLAVESATGKTSIAALTFAEADQVIAKLGGQTFASRRTVQLHRRKAGVVQVVQPGQLELIAMLASQRHWQPETLVEFCKRQTGHHPLRTTKDANKVIEALKSMNKRDGLWH